MLKNIKSLPGRMRIFRTPLRPIRFASPALSDEQKIRIELQTILASEFFRGSKRCQSFLTFVVEAVLSGDADQLKERTLGIEVFHRSPSYDTGEDAIVRVKANEVRRRLAQYGATADSEKIRQDRIAAGLLRPPVSSSRHRSLDNSGFLEIEPLVRPGLLDRCLFYCSSDIGGSCRWGFAFFEPLREILGASPQSPDNSHHLPWRSGCVSPELLRSAPNIADQIPRRSI